MRQVLYFPSAKEAFVVMECLLPTVSSTISDLWLAGAFFPVCQNSILIAGRLLFFAVVFGSFLLH